MDFAIIFLIVYLVIVGIIVYCGIYVWPRKYEPPPAWLDEMSMRMAEDDLKRTRGL